MLEADVRKMIVEFLKAEPGPLKENDLVTEVIENSGFSGIQIVDILEAMVEEGVLFESDGVIYLKALDSSDG